LATLGGDPFWVSPCGPVIEVAGAVCGKRTRQQKSGSEGFVPCLFFCLEGNDCVGEDCFLCAPLRSGYKIIFLYFVDIQIVHFFTFLKDKATEPHIYRLLVDKFHRIWFFRNCNGGILKIDPNFLIVLCLGMMKQDEIIWDSLVRVIFFEV